VLQGNCTAVVRFSGSAEQPELSVEPTMLTACTPFASNEESISMFGSYSAIAVTSGDYKKTAEKSASAKGNLFLTA
jgi:hypothetical protein